MAAPIPPEALHQFLMQHPIGQAIAAHTGYGPGHPMHDIHHRRMAAPQGGPATPSALAGNPMMARRPVPQAPMPGASPLGAIPPPPGMPMAMPQTGGARPPLPSQGAAPQGPPSPPPG